MKTAKQVKKIIESIINESISISDLESSVRNGGDIEIGNYDKNNNDYQHIFYTSGDGLQSSNGWDKEDLDSSQFSSIIKLALKNGNKIKLNGKQIDIS